MKRLVVKIGTNVLTRRDGTLDVTRVSALVDQVVGLRKAGYAVVIVSSGAVACGRTELRMDDDLDGVAQ
ncbi:MAG: glutamate 5-kinase, partial [Bacteroidales bacterium]|nr:glutamate 5-kinase [Bacteroidales bacterium]